MLKGVHMTPENKYTYAMSIDNGCPGLSSTVFSKTVDDKIFESILLPSDDHTILEFGEVYLRLFI